jgi:hypothetical protein
VDSFVEPKKGTKPDSLLMTLVVKIIVLVLVARSIKGDRLKQKSGPLTAVLGTVRLSGQFLK